jgi:hypothetical protein
MAGFWSPFDSKEKRARLAFLGGGIAAVAAALWAVFTYLKPPEPAPKASAPNVAAKSGGIAVGGNVTGSTISATPSASPPASRAEPKPKANNARASLVFDERGGGPRASMPLVRVGQEGGCALTHLLSVLSKGTLSGRPTRGVLSGISSTWADSCLDLPRPLATICAPVGVR